MEQLKAKLFRLLKDEIDDLSIGHTYNLNRLRQMKEICHLITYYKYVDLDETDIIKIIRF